MKAGETVRCDCEACSIEFEVLLEPKAKGTKEEGKGKKEIVKHCPFCGGPVTSDED